MTDRDDADRWMDVLAGKAEATDADTRVAARLRSAMKANQTMDSTPDSASNTRIMNMLRAKGAFDDPVPDAAPASSLLSRALAWLWPAESGQSMTGRYAAVATVAAAAVLVPALYNAGQTSGGAQGDAPAYTKSTSAPGAHAAPEAVVYTAKPQEASQRLQLVLKRHGIEPEVTQDQTARTVMATVPAPLRAQVSNDLMAFGIGLPEDGRLHIKFVVTP